MADDVDAAAAASDADIDEVYARAIDVIVATADPVFTQLGVGLTAAFS